MNFLNSQPESSHPFTWWHFVTETDICSSSVLSGEKKKWFWEKDLANSWYDWVRPYCCS